MGFKLVRHSCALMIILMASGTSSGQLPFSRGVNLTQWFQAPNARQIQFSKFSKKDFENIKSLGCDVVRLPINLHAMTSGEPDYILDPMFLEFLDQVVDWTEELEIHLILDNHTFDVSTNTDPSIEGTLVKVWTQMAFHYKDRSDRLYYEVLNEPHGIDDAVWNAIQETVIEAIRSEDTRHFIVVGGAGWNSYNNLKNIPVYADPKLIYTFHFYDPFVFTHQGASWVNPSMVPLAGVPFPYAPGAMPATPASLRGSWVESALNNYSNDGTPTKVKQLIDVAVAFKEQRGVPVYCGEFGVFIPNSPEVDRVAWYSLVSSYLSEKGIPWTIWDYTGGFGVFEKNSAEYFEHDLNVPLLEGLGLNAPPQTDFIEKPLTKGFTIYADDLGEGIINGSYPGNGILDYYSSENPQEGSHCIYWTGVGQYQAMSFNFKRDLDLYLLKNNDHVLEFYVRGNNSSAKFDVRFIDTDMGAADLPWRMGKTISDIPADDAWHLVQIPLSQLEEKGAWEDGVYHPPDGGDHFNWRFVDRFEIIPEHQPLDGIEFYFDNIRVTGEEVIVSVSETGKTIPAISVYPNPIKGHARIFFSLKEASAVEISLFTIRGEKVTTLFHEEALAGSRVVSWDRSDLTGGLFFILMQSETGVQSVKIMVKE